MKKITIASNSMEPITFESNANTLGELKTELRSKSINHDGMTFKEGTTRTILMDDSSILPTTKADGTEIPELFIMMSAGTKKIKSGSERTDLYAKIKTILATNPTLKKELGNYTCKSNEEISKFITKYSKATVVKEDTIISKEQAIDYLTKVADYLRHNDNIIIDKIPTKCTEKAVELKPTVVEKKPVVEQPKSTFSKSQMSNMMKNLN